MSEGSQYGNPHLIRRRLDELILGRASLLLLVGGGRQAEPSCASLISNYPGPNAYAHAPKHKRYKKECQILIIIIKKKMLPLNEPSQWCKCIQTNSCSHALKRARSGAATKSLLCHLLTHIHNVSLSPAAHQGLGKLPGMKEICSLMAPFSCIWWHKKQLDLVFFFFFWAVESPNMLNDGLFSPLYSLKGSF